jgi:hypothetical protein
VTFKTVYDAAQQGYDWSLAPLGLIGLIFVAVAMMMLLVDAPDIEQRSLPSRSPLVRERLIRGRFFLGFAIVYTAIFPVVTLSQHWETQKLLRNPHLAVAEGPVTDFIPMPASGHAMETFKVQGQNFSYSDFVIVPGFHNATSHGGPIRDGLNVRVTHVGNVILKIEVAQ